jgi:glycosyltransferase involved in cell wall biosynthesis
MRNDFPLVSLCILTYNQERYIRETVEGALSQDYPNLEIVISDDNSTDSTFRIIKEMTAGYVGPHSLIVNQNNPNKGIIEHVNRVVFELSHGDYIMLSGGDDICMSQTVSFAVKKCLEEKCDSIAFNANIIDANSQITGYLHNITDYGVCIYGVDEYLSGRYKTNGACRLVKRVIYEKFGKFDKDCPTEDTPSLFRTFLYGRVGFCAIPNINYRIHGENISGFHNLMTKFDPRKIYSQYKRDLDIAYGCKLINDEYYKKIQCHIKKYLYDNIAIRYIYNQPLYSLRLMCAASFAIRPHYSFIQAKKYVRMVIQWHKNGIL